MGSFCRAVSSFLSSAHEATATARCLSLEFFLAKGCLPTVQRLLGGAGETKARKVSALQLAIQTTLHETHCSDALMRAISIHRARETVPLDLATVMAAGLG